MGTWSNLSNHQCLSQQNDRLMITTHIATTWIKESEEGLNCSVVTHHLDVRVFGEQSVIWHGLKERSSILSYCEPCRKHADAAAASQRVSTDRQRLFLLHGAVLHRFLCASLTVVMVVMMLLFLLLLFVFLLFFLLLLFVFRGLLLKDNRKEKVDVLYI